VCCANLNEAMMGEMGPCFVEVSELFYLLEGLVWAWLPGSRVQQAVFLFFLVGHSAFVRVCLPVRSLSVSFFIEKEPRKQLRMKRKRKGER
jgi:hypothetical protein